MDNNKHAYWIHKQVPSKNAVSGYFFTRECTCSECGKEVNMEKKRCPYCGAIMDAQSRDSEK